MRGDQCSSCAAAWRGQVEVGRAAWDDRHIFTVCPSTRCDDRRCTQTTEACSKHLPHSPAAGLLPCSCANPHVC